MVPENRRVEMVNRDIALAHWVAERFSYVPREYGYLWLGEINRRIKYLSTIIPGSQVPKQVAYGPYEDHLCRQLKAK